MQSIVRRLLYGTAAGSSIAVSSLVKRDGPSIEHTVAAAGKRFIHSNSQRPGKGALASASETTSATTLLSKTTTKTSAYCTKMTILTSSILLSASLFALYPTSHISTARSTPPTKDTKDTPPLKELPKDVIKPGNHMLVSNGWFIVL
jgi:hypothetical protein